MIGQIDAILRKEYGINPETIEFDEWCKLYAEWQFTTKINHENLKATILDAASEILKAIFPNEYSKNDMDS